MIYLLAKFTPLLRALTRSLIVESHYFIVKFLFIVKWHLSTIKRRTLKLNENAKKAHLASGSIEDFHLGGDVVYGDAVPVQEI